MRLHLPMSGVAVAALFAFIVVSPVASDPSALHFGLAKSAPADSSTVQMVPEVRLWFTEVPTERTVTVRLLAAGGELVPTDPLAQDPDDGTVFSIGLLDALKSGTYSVSWRGMGADGHVVQGSFTFFVAAP